MKENEKGRDLRGAFSDTEDYLDHGLVSSNRCASRTSSIGSWSEFIKPSFTQKLTFRSVLEGEPAVFRCKLVACPVPKVSWFHNNKPIRKDKRRVTKTESDMHIHFCSLLVKDVEDRDSGSYRIFAINSEGSAESTASLLVALKEEQNPKYLDFVRFSEKTHESIDSLVQKKKESKVKVDLKCVGSPFDKRRETRIMRNQYPKKGIVKTISFENIISGETQSKGHHKKKLESEKLLDKEIQAKLQKLRELKRARGSRSSVCSSDVYSDIDSLQSDTSFQIEKESYKLSSFLDVPRESEKVSGLDKLPISIPQIKEPIISNVPQEILEAGISDSSMFKRTEEETRLIHSESISTISKCTFNEILIESDQQTDYMDNSEQSKPLESLFSPDNVIDNITNQAAENIDSALELAEPIQMNLPIKSQVLQDRSEISYVGKRAQTFSHSDVEFFQSQSTHDTSADTCEEIPGDNFNWLPLQADEELTDLSKLESFSDQPVLDLMQKEETGNEPEPLEEKVQMNEPVRSKIRQGPFQASNTYQGYLEMVQEEHQERSDEDLTDSRRFVHESGPKNYEEKVSEHTAEHDTFIPHARKLQEKPLPYRHIRSQRYDKKYEPNLEHETDLKKEAFGNFSKSVNVSQQISLTFHEDDHKMQLLLDGVQGKQKHLAEIGTRSPVTDTGNYQIQMQGSNLEAREQLEMYKSVKSRILKLEAENRPEYLSKKHIKKEKLSLREHKKVHELIDYAFHEKGTAVNEENILSIVDSHLEISEKDAIPPPQDEEKDLDFEEPIQMHKPVTALIIPEAPQINKSVTSKILLKPTEATLMHLQAHEQTRLEKLLDSNRANQWYRNGQDQKELSLQKEHIYAEDDASTPPFINIADVQRGKDDSELAMTEPSENVKPDACKVFQEPPKSNLIESPIQNIEYNETRQSWIESKQEDKYFHEMFRNIDQKVQEYYSEMDPLLITQDTHGEKHLIDESYESKIPNFTEINQSSTSTTIQHSYESGLSTSVTDTLQHKVSSMEFVPQIFPDVEEKESAIATPAPDFSLEPLVEDTRLTEVNKYAKLESSDSFKVIEKSVSKIQVQPVLIDQQEEVTTIESEESFGTKTFSERKHDKAEIFPPDKEDREIPIELNVEHGSHSDTYDEPIEKDVQLELPALKEIEPDSGKYLSDESEISESPVNKKMTPCPPIFTQDIESQEVFEGDSCTFTCHFHGYPQPTVSWYNNDKSIPRNEAFVIVTTETKSTLTFSTVLPQHAGSITCVIFNQYGTDTTFGKLKVEGRENQDQNESKALVKCEMLISEHFTEGEDEELVSLLTNAEEKSITDGVNRFSLQLPQVSYDMPCKSDMSLSLPVEIKVTAPTPVPDYEELEESFQTVESEQKKSPNNKQKIKHKFTFGFDGSKKAKETIQENEIKIDIKEEACPVLECIISEDSEPQMTWHQSITELEKEDETILDNEALTVSNVSTEETENASISITCETQETDNVIQAIDETINEKSSNQDNQIDFKEKVQSSQFSDYDSTDITNVRSMSVIVSERTELDDTVSGFVKDIRDEEVKTDTIPQSNEEKDLPLSVVTVENKNVLQDSVSTVLQLKTNETIEIKLDAVTESTAEQKLGSISKDLVEDGTKKELPMVPKRRHSFIKRKSSIDTENKPIESKETTDIKKPLPVVPQRRHSFVRRRSSVAETTSIDQRELQNESVNINVKKELPTPPPRRRAMVKTQVTYTEPKPLQAKPIGSDNVYKTKKGDNEQAEQPVMQPSEDNKFRLNLDELVKKDEVQNLNEIEDISYLGLFEGEDIMSNDYLMSIVSNQSIEYENDGQHMNIQENNLEDTQRNDYLKEGVSTSENVVSEPPNYDEQFNIPHSQISAQSPSVLPEDVKSRKDFQKGEITSLEVEDVTFDTVYEFYKNQSARPFSPESEMSIEAGSIFSDEAIDIEQFYTPPSSAERFYSPLSETFLTPATSPDRYFTPVQQIVDPDTGTECQASSDIANPSQKGLKDSAKERKADKEEIGTEVQKPPAFIKPLLKKRVFENNLLSFAVEVVGCPAPVVKWYRNSVALEKEDRLKIREEGNMHILEIHNIQANEGGKYSCIAVNPIGEAKSFTQVEILPLDGKSCALPPPVTHQHVMEFDMEQYTTSRSPSPQEILLEVELDESEVKDFEKQVKILTIPEFSPDSKSMVISLDVLPLAFDDQNTASNSKDSDDVKINFEVTEKPPQFSQHISDLNVTSGSNAEFHCCVEGMPTPTIKWFKESECITPESTRCLIKEGEGKHSLMICGVDMSDAGTYICKAENSYGEVTCKALLGVMDADAAEEKMKESPDVPFVDAECMTQVYKETIDQKVSNEDEIEVEFEFQSDNNEVNKAVELIAVTGSECEEGREKCLNIQFDVFDKPSSVEEVQFNAKGSESCCFEFQVTESPPKFLTPILDSTASVGTQANFKCVVLGSPIPDVCWYKDDNLVQGEKYILDEEQNGCHQLTINNIDAGDEGQYICVATNKGGTAETIASLTIT